MATIDPAIQELLSELFAHQKQYFLICDAFKIRLEDRGKSYKAEQILERIRTYLTTYIARRSIEEQENGAAFELPEFEPIGDLDDKPTG